ncbi:MAG: citrate lyase holo-[acyl-carrier protein] synthase [Eubacteriales bacterium]
MEIHGEKIELEEILFARERRVATQSKLIESHQLPLISFTLNIVGEIKVFPLTIKTYEKGKALISNYCKIFGLSVVALEEITEKTGYEAFFVVDAPPLSIKKMVCEIEMSELLGRIFDLDIIQVSGEKISRTALKLPPRTCLLCEQEAFLCARSRAHPIQEVLEKEIDIMSRYFNEEYAKNLGRMAGKALLFEVNTTPKPGLVDRSNTGSHSDMNLQTFEDSALSLIPFFEDFVRCGIENVNNSPRNIFFQAKKLGIKAENAMFSATKGVNTHKGVIFSMGLFCTTLGVLYARNIPYHPEIFLQLCGEILQPFQETCQELSQPKTKGGKSFLAQESGGIRKEALEGYPSIFSCGLPVYSLNMKQGFSQNDAGVLTLLHILAHTEDSNIVARSNRETYEKITQKVRHFLASDQGDFMEFATELDREFIEKNISAGGSADLLALTYFLYLLE